MAWPFKKKEEPALKSSPLNVDLASANTTSSFGSIGSASSANTPSINSSGLDAKKVEQVVLQNRISKTVSDDLKKTMQKNTDDLMSQLESDQKNIEPNSAMISAALQSQAVQAAQGEQGVQGEQNQQAQEETSAADSDGMSFYIDLRPKLINLTTFASKREIDIRYPLMPPFAYAHIYWNDKEKEVFYEVEEPILDDAEKEVLGLIQLALEEMINVSFIRATKTNLIMQYLEGNVKSILVELGLELTKESYQKVMYFVYRDSVGLNEIEPLLNDYYIEDIECNGIDFPIYIVHRKYDTIRTNVLFKEKQKATDFVEKLAQKCGRYVSYAKPLLDGTLPDGSRVNATYTDDVTTRGPTFTIRKFTKDPWTPIHMVKYNTMSAEAIAFMWLAIEYKSNIIVIGETGSGKTTLLNSLAYFIPPEARICSIEDTRELNLVHENWLPAVTRTGFGIPNILGEQYGEITLFDLLKETFRQNPDYVILGETRGKETYVLFQGMASGHPSFCTFHAASVETLVRRLETPPINLPSSLIESIDVVLVITHVRSVNDEEKNVRRLKELAEIISVKQELGRVEYSNLYTWDPIADAISRNAKKSVVLEKISKRVGTSIEDLEKEIITRKKLLLKLAEKDMLDFNLFAKIVNAYYKQKEAVLSEWDIQ